MFRNLVLPALMMSGMAVAQQYPQPQYPAPQQPPQQQYPQQQPSYPQQPYPQQQPYPPQTQQYPPQQQAPPPLQGPEQLQQLVAPIALYPDGLLAQVLTASSYSDQLPDAAGWANQHAYIHGDRLADAIRADNLQFAPSVMALLPFPQTLSYLAQNMAWTEQLGNAVLAQRADVMDAVQAKRNEAYNYGYLRDPQFAQYERVVVAGPRLYEIYPVNPGTYYVPYYNPLVVFAPLHPRAFVGGFFSFGGGIQIGAAFSPFGWSGGGVGFGWREHNIMIDNRPWSRSWGNREQYVHPYAQPYRPVVGPRTEGHNYGNDRRGFGRDEHREERHDEHHDH